MPLWAHVSDLKVWHLSCQNNTTWMIVGLVTSNGTRSLRDAFISGDDARTAALVEQTFAVQGLDRLPDETRCSQTIAGNTDLIVGVKARTSVGIVGKSGVEPLRAVRRMHRSPSMPLMARTGLGPPAPGDVLRELRAEDVLTHCCISTSMRRLNEYGLIGNALWTAATGGSSSTSATQPARIRSRQPRHAEQGLCPDFISMNHRVRSLRGPIFDTQTTMNKLRLPAMPLIDATGAAATTALTGALSYSTGVLFGGAPANMTILSAQSEGFRYFDSHPDQCPATERLLNIATYVANRGLPPALLPGMAIRVHQTGSVAAMTMSTARHQRWKDRLASVTRDQFNGDRSVRNTTKDRKMQA